MTIFTGVKSTLGLFILLICCAMIPGDQPVYYGSAVRQNGITTYIYCLPAREYDTVCSFSTDVSFNSYAGPSIPNRTIGIEKPVDALVRKALKKSKRNRRKKKQEINAIISPDAQKAVAIHYKTRVDEAKVNRSIVQQYKGYYVYIQNQPAHRYEVVSKVKITSQLDLQFTGYAHLNTMLDSLITRYEKNIVGDKADALVTSNGIEAEFIRFNK